MRLGIARLARQLRQQAGTGLTPTLLSALSTIYAAGPLTPGELAALEQVTAPTITRVVTKLAHDGLVYRAEDPNDRRRGLLSVTAEGRRRLEHSRTLRTAWLARRLLELEAADRAKLAESLEVIERIAVAPEHPDARNSDEQGVQER